MERCEKCGQNLPNKLDMVKKIIEDSNSEFNSYFLGGSYDGKYFHLPLPNANDEWTFEAFRVAKLITTALPRSFIDWSEKKANKFESSIPIRL